MIASVFWFSSRVEKVYGGAALEMQLWVNSVAVTYKARDPRGDWNCAVTRFPQTNPGLTNIPGFDALCALFDSTAGLAHRRLRT